MASERQDRLRALVLAACEDLGRYGLEPTPEAVAAVSALIVNASRLGAEVDAAAEIARLAREMKAARERERAVRDEATGYLAEVAETLADMHYGEECSFEGGEGCLACYAQDRIAEMQDALAARRGDGGGA